MAFPASHSNSLSHSMKFATSLSRSMNFFPTMDILLTDITRICVKACRNKKTATYLNTLIEKVEPMIREVEISGVELSAQRHAQISRLYTITENGKKLIENVHSSHRLNIPAQLTLAMRMEKFENVIISFLRSPVLTNILIDLHRLQANSDMHSDLDKIFETMGALLDSMENRGGGMVRDPMELAEATREIQSNDTATRLEVGKKLLEEWELQYGPIRFAYKELYIATKKFEEKQLLGRGGFGQVYKGSLPGSDAEIAVKRTSHDSKQGMREFLAEISTIGCLKHPNLVRLLGYCKHKEELFLVYDYMPNGSLDKYMSRNGNQQRLTWEQRFKIIKDVAAALLYMHQECKQVIIHRDIKPGNILIDHEMNARLADFGLAKLYDHGFDPQTLSCVGTPWYMALEFGKTGSATTDTDVYAFGVVMLEVVCGRRLFAKLAAESEEDVKDWILDLLEKGKIFDATEESIRREENKGQIELDLKLGVSCSHQTVSNRPDISTIMKILNGNLQLPGNLLDVVRHENFRGPHETSLMEILLGVNSFDSHEQEIVEHGQQIQCSKIEDNEQEIQSSVIEDNEQEIQSSKLEDNEHEIQSSKIEDNEQEIQSSVIEDIEQEIQCSELEDNEQEIQNSEIEDNKQEVHSFEIEDDKQI